MQTGIRKNSSCVRPIKKKCAPPIKPKCYKHHKPKPKPKPKPKCKKAICCHLPSVNVCKIKKPVKIVSPVRVVAKNLNIRNLNPKRDKVEIFGTDGKGLKAIRTDSNGRIEVVPAPNGNTIFFEEQFLSVTATNEFTSLPMQDTSTLITYSYAVINRGEAPALITVEISPNAADYAVDTTGTVPPGEMLVFVPNRFLRGTRLTVLTEEIGSSTVLDVYFQAQTLGSGNTA